MFLNRSKFLLALNTKFLNLIILTMKTLAKYHVCNHFIIGQKTLKNILIGPGKLAALSRNEPLVLVLRRSIKNRSNFEKLRRIQSHITQTSSCVSYILSNFVHVS